MGRRPIEDKLVEFKPRTKGAIWGVRNYNYRALVLYHGEPRGSWERRYSVSLDDGRDVLGGAYSTNSLSEAKRHARQRVRGRAFRAFIRRVR